MTATRVLPIVTSALVAVAATAVVGVHATSTPPVVQAVPTTSRGERAAESMERLAEQYRAAFESLNTQPAQGDTP